MTENSLPRVRRTIGDGRPQDEGRGVARLDPEDLAHLGVDVGSAVAVGDPGEEVYLRALPTYGEDRNQQLLQLDATARNNLGRGSGEVVEVRPAQAIPTAQSVRVEPVRSMPDDDQIVLIGRSVDGLVVQQGHRLAVRAPTGKHLLLKVVHTVPSSPVEVGPTTRLSIEPAAGDGEGSGQEVDGPGAYADVGGLETQLDQIREILEWPLRAPQVFDRLGIDPPKGVLLHGPPGCGKTLLARAVARETGAAFYSISGPEVIQKFYGESEARLREIFEAAAANAPAIVFLDEIDTLAPHREDAAGDVERRVVATLLTLLDGMKNRGQVIVLGATNRPNAIDPALRRPGRFDREIPIPIPDAPARRQILEVHTREMPLGREVALDGLAATTHGYVGADLEALCRESAINALRRNLGPHQALEDLELGSLTVEQADFEQALRHIKPSAVREVMVEHPRTSWSEIGGHHGVRQRLIETLQWPLRYGELFQAADLRPPRGILLHGPPGCGKTLLARAAASEININFINIKGPELFDKYVGATERRLREIFAIARRGAPTMIFFDEIDALAPRRRAGHSEEQVSERLLGQFLTALDGLEDRGKVFVLGATNRLDRIDEALLRPGRFDHVIALELPDEAQRAEIFTVHLRRRPGGGELDVHDLASRTDGFSGAEIAEVCRRATFQALRRLVLDGEADRRREQLCLQPLDLVRAITELQEQRESY